MAIYDDERYMKEALKQAKKAYTLGEAPIGCVVIRNSDGKIVGRGYNRRNTDHTTLSHAEMTAIKKASKAQGDWRLEGYTIYVTLEPCPMCAGAIVQSRMDRCVYGAASPKSGCAGSIMDLFSVNEFNHQVETKSGVLSEECSEILSDFFKNLRFKLKSLKEEAGKESEVEDETI
ncbi:MAG: tRNA adenosine(34) deaminase TadA [Lachnospiraceae bacterium]|nr:tRNA adenosine(34) deaminase TadA [Lachnospiraceae bacterium]